MRSGVVLQGDDLIPLLVRPNPSNSLFELLSCPHTSLWFECGTSRKGGKSVLLVKSTLWKYNLNFVKDVPTTCVDFITNISVLSEDVVPTFDLC